jgi:hypothetical protein
VTFYFLEKFHSITAEFILSSSFSQNKTKQNKTKSQNDKTNKNKNLIELVSSYGESSKNWEVPCFFLFSFCMWRLVCWQSVPLWLAHSVLSSAVP